jgi:hypothetical protein
MNAKSKNAELTNAKSMNAKSNVRELDRIRGDIACSLRTGHDVAEPAPHSLMALLKDLETRVRDAERERLFTAVDARVAELMRAIGREPRATKDTQALRRNAPGPLRAA